MAKQFITICDRKQEGQIHRRQTAVVIGCRGHGCILKRAPDPRLQAIFLRRCSMPTCIRWIVTRAAWTVIQSKLKLVRRADNPRR